MRIGRYDPGQQDSPRTCLVDRENDSIVDIEAVGDSLGFDVPADVPSLLDQYRWRERLEIVEAYAGETGEGVHSLDEVSLRAPIERPGKIVCVGLNYVEHIEEGDEEAPENPLLFSKYANAIVGPNQPISWSPDLTDQVDYEVELAVVVGERARRIEADEANDYVAGYTIANDVSARDLQFADEQWVRGKTLDTFCPLGPEIVTGDDVDDAVDLALWTDLNGERVQESTTANMIYDIPELVSFCSQAFTLLPGDVILTGTPPGVGVFCDPPRLLDDGDTVTVGVEGIGELSNPCEHD